MLRLLVCKSVVAIASVVLLVGCGGGAAGEAEPSVPSSPPVATKQVQSSSASSGSVVKVVNRDTGGSGKYEFAPSEFTFSVGETITFELTAETEFHTFTVDQLDIDLGLEAEETVEFTFTFNEAGTFDLVCLSHPQMTGTIVVQ